MSFFRVGAEYIQHLPKLFYFVFLLPVSIFAFEGQELTKKIKIWENKNANKAIVLITSPKSGRIEFAYDEESAYNRKLPPGSIMKTLSSFVLLAYPQKFKLVLEEKYFCNGRFEEPYLNYFKKKDREKFNIIEGNKLSNPYFRCSLFKGHGEISIREALAHSCNAYYLHFASQNSESFYRTLVSDWKLKEGTGASFEHKPRIMKTNLSHQTKFTYSLESIGEGGIIQLTILKIAQIYGAIMSGTEILKPIEKGETPEILSPFPYTETLRKEINDFLKLTVGEGTLKNLKLRNTSIKIIAGKTGTPTQRGKKVITHGWNIIYFLKGEIPYLLVAFTEKGSASKETLILSKTILNYL